MTMPAAKFVVLAVLDGWGIAPPGPGNAVTQAQTPNINKFWVSYPHALLKASGQAVGLPRGEAGNTETGHLNLGAGRIVYQDLARIDMAIADGSFFENKTFAEAIAHAQKQNSKLHLLGLVGAGGVHSNLEHLFALIQLAAKKGLKNLYLHLFTDGRDSPPTAAKSYIERIREVIKKEGVGQIASIMGRYWAMDRDRRWERTAKAYLALTQGQGELVKTPEETIQASYSAGVTDEFIEPALISDAQGKPLSLIQDNDAVIFYNFRIDRPRQLTASFIVDDFETISLEFDPYLERYQKTHLPQKALAQKEVKSFSRGKKLNNLFFVTMTEYSKILVKAGAKVAFPPEKIEMPLGRVVAENGLKQLRIAESEKERFVTFYFNGQQELAFPGEDRLIVPSPKVPTYDQKPEMSAREITQAAIKEIQSQNQYSFILINYANPDMVGHTGNLQAGIKACEIVDECVGQLANVVLAHDGVLLVTADHGNVEEMINLQTGGVDTEHSSNQVLFIAVSKNFLGNNTLLPTGILADLGPTVLSLLGLQTPSSMTGRNLVSLLEK